MPDPILAVIDGHYYAYRFFFGMPPLSGPGGRPTGVTYAFAKLLKDLRADPAITHWACVFDVGESFRNRLYPAYKAQRDPTPPESAAPAARCRAHPHRQPCAGDQGRACAGES